MQILDEGLVDDPEESPDIRVAYACKQLYNESTILVTNKFAFVRAHVFGFDKLARVVKKKDSTAIHKFLNTPYMPPADLFWMDLLVSGHGGYKEQNHSFILVGLTNLRAFLKATILARGHDLPQDRDFDPKARDLEYRLNFWSNKSKSASEKLKQICREEQLFQPFFELFWSGFKNVSVKGCDDDELAKKLVKHARQNRWKNPEELIATLNQAREEGKAAYLKGDLVKAHRFWQEGLDLKVMTVNSPQGYDFMVNRSGRAYGAKFDEVIFHLESNLAAVLLKLAQEPRRTHKEKMDLAADAHQACVFAIDFTRSRNFIPSSKQVGKVHYRMAQSLRLRGCLRGNLKQAEQCLAQAMKLCPDDQALKDEARQIELTMLAEMAQGNYKAAMERVHASGCHCGC